MKKKLILPQSGGGQTPGARCETAYEELRSAVTEGAAYHAGKASGLTVIVNCGTLAWIREQQAPGAKAHKPPPAAKARARGQKQIEGQMTMLFANLFETEPADGSFHAEN